VVDDVLEYWPERCSCGHQLGEAEHVPVGDSLRYQVEGLPVITVKVTEHRAQRLRCPGCAQHTRGQFPAEIIQSAFGSCLRAAIATLSVGNRISRRDLVELAEQLFGSRISTGTVDAILTRTSQALSEPHVDLLERLRCAHAVNMDETGWRTAGERRALWGVFDQRHAYLHVGAGRHEDHAKELLADTKAIVTSDRWWAYSHLPLKRRQLCWAHLKRDFAAHAEGLAGEKGVRRTRP
jgi:transposase